MDLQGLISVIMGKPKAALNFFAGVITPPCTCGNKKNQSERNAPGMEERQSVFEKGFP